MAEPDENAGGAGARDDDAAFAEIVAAFRQQPAAGPDAQPWPEAENLSEEPTAGSPREEGTAEGTPAQDTGEGEEQGRGPGVDRPVGSFVVYAPGVGPRDWTPSQPSDNDLDETDEGHFVPPEPPPLPPADTTARFAWLAVLGGPLLLLGVVLLRWEMTWWITTLGVGGFLGGFATLVMRMADGDEDDDDPGRGAVV